MHIQRARRHAGLNVYEGTVIDMLGEGVLEPLRSKRQSIQSASETAVMLIRVDDMMITQSRAPGRRAPGRIIIPVHMAQKRVLPPDHPFFVLSHLFRK